MWRRSFRLTPTPLWTKKEKLIYWRKWKLSWSFENWIEINETLLKSRAKENINSFCEPQVSITYTCQTRLVNLEIPDIIWSCWDNVAPHGLSIMFKSRSEYRKRLNYFTNLFADPETLSKYVLHFVSTKICSFEIAWKLVPVSIFENWDRCFWMLI